MTLDMPASVRGRLERLAHETERPLQELMQYFAMERFLFRLSQSKYSNRFILKGALLFTVWGTSRSRVTRDIDLLATGDNSVEAMVDLLQEVCEQPVKEDGVVFERDSLRGIAIQEDAEYPGVRVTFHAKIQNARLPMQIDIGFGDVIHPSATMLEYPTMLDFAAPTIAAYPKETVIAEKFEAMLKLGQLNSRMKDFYDIYTLSSKFSFDSEVLAVAIEKTFANRGTSLELEPYVFSKAFLEDKTKQIQWAVFLRKSKLTDAPDTIAETLHAIERFLLPLCRAIASNQKLAASWMPSSYWSTR